MSNVSHSYACGIRPNSCDRRPSRGTGGQSDGFRRGFVRTPPPFASHKVELDQDICVEMSKFAFASHSYACSIRPNSCGRRPNSCDRRPSGGTESIRQFSARLLTHPASPPHTHMRAPLQHPKNGACAGYLRRNVQRALSRPIPAVEGGTPAVEGRIPAAELRTRGVCCQSDEGLYAPLHSTPPHTLCFSRYTFLYLSLFACYCMSFVWSNVAHGSTHFIWVITRSSAHSYWVIPRKPVCGHTSA